MATKHARFSPSKLENLEKCLRFSYKETEDGAADEGTELHEALATGNRAGLNEEQLRQVESIHQYVESIKVENPEIEDRREWKIEVKDLTYGTADVVLHGKTAAFVFDAKFGRKGATEAKDNFQIACYCCGLLETYPELEQVTGGILAPRAQGISTHVFTRDDIPKIRKRIEDLYARLENPFLDPTPDDELCALCKWASQCPALGKLVKVTAEGIGLPVPTAFKPESLIAPEDRSIGQMIAGALENWAEQVKKGNTEYVKNGGEIPGFKMITKSSGARVPRDLTLSAYSALLADGFESERVIGSMSLSIPELAKAEADAHGTTEAEAREGIRKTLGELVQEGQYSYLTKVKKGADAAKRQLNP